MCREEIKEEDFNLKKDNPERDCGILAETCYNMNDNHSENVTGANRGIRVNRRYKDTLFRKLFGENRENALSLYNAVNGSAYTNAEDLEFTTLEDVVYMKYKNDVSFLFGSSLNLYEHQSTFNPNMPLRGFLYFADLYRQLISDEAQLYGRTRVRLPAPRYIVFYNGPDKTVPERMTLRLSDAFETFDKDGTASDYEWTAYLYNINADVGRALLEDCTVLNEYAVFVAKVRLYAGEKDLATAVDRAVEECIVENVLRDFLERHRREVKDMTLTEFDEAKYEKMIREEGRIQGYVESAIDFGSTKEAILAGLTKKFSLSPQEAKDVYDMYAGVSV